jgi:hypothetical protein
MTICHYDYDEYKMIWWWYEEEWLLVSLDSATHLAEYMDLHVVLMLLMLILVEEQMVLVARPVV